MIDKRVLLEHTSEPYGGIVQILGCVSAVVGKETIPEFIPVCGLLGTRMAAVCLIKVTPRYVWYKELSGVETRKFNEFHPEQK